MLHLRQCHRRTNIIKNTIFFLCQSVQISKRNFKMENNFKQICHRDATSTRSPAITTLLHYECFSLFTSNYEDNLQQNEMIITKHKYVATKPDHSHTFAYGNCIAHNKTLEFVDGGRVAPTLLYSYGFAFFYINSVVTFIQNK